MQPSFFLCHEVQRTFPASPHLYYITSQHIYISYLHFSKRRKAGWFVIHQTHTPTLLLWFPLLLIYTGQCTVSSRLAILITSLFFFKQYIFIWVTGDWAQSLCPELHAIILAFFVCLFISFCPVFAKLPRSGSNLEVSHLRLPQCWNYTPVPPCKAYFLMTHNICTYLEGTMQDFSHVYIGYGTIPDN